MTTEGSTILLCDGGQGTTLKDEHHQPLSNQPLWASELLITNQQTIKQLHQTWEEAGANIISTISYQATSQAIQQLTNTTREEAIKLLQSSVTLARESLTKAGTQVALSLGPYGATLTPGQEYTGEYPTPYDTEAGLEEFHHGRLEEYASDGGTTWAQLDMLLFETIPSLIETRAIRLAYKKLLQNYPNLSEKPLVISFVFPATLNGHFPSGDPPSNVLRAALSPHPLLARPSAIGINCTKLHHLPSILQAWSHHPSQDVSLWLYPDGGQIYDTITRNWSTTSPPISPEEWAKQLLHIAHSVSPHWNTIVLGGCCKAGTSHIRALHQLLATHPKS